MDATGAVVAKVTEGRNAVVFAVGASVLTIAAMLVCCVAVGVVVPAPASGSTDVTFCDSISEVVTVGFVSPVAFGHTSNAVEPFVAESLVVCCAAVVSLSEPVLRGSTVVVSAVVGKDPAVVIATVLVAA